MGKVLFGEYMSIVENMEYICFWLDMLILWILGFGIL